VNGELKMVNEKHNSKFKQTDIGLIPEDWEVKKLREITDVVGGGTPDTFIKKYWNGNINWFTPTEIGINKYTFESIRKIAEEGLKNSSARILPVGTILLTSRAGIGDLSILQIEGCTNQGFQSLIPKKWINNEFLYYLMITLKNVLIKNAGGSTFLEISPNRIKEIRIPLPPLPEQKAISEVLSDTDSLIQSIEKRIAKKRMIKQGAMQKLLSPKDGWEVKKLGEIFTITRGLVLSMNSLYNDIIGDYKYPVYSSQTKNKGLTGYYTDYLFENSITWTTDGANAGDVKFRKGKFYCTNVCGVLKSDKGYANLCIAEAFNSISKRYVSYVGNPKLMNNVVANIEIALPPIEEQTRIATILSDMDAEIETLEKKLAKYKQIKQGMMQNLLTGKIRLNNEL
jgi:type I restriction enzyme S subunit